MKKPPETLPVTNPDLVPLRRAVEEYLAYLRGSGKLSGNGVQNHERQVFQEAVKAFYGPRIFEEVNELSMKIDR